MELESQDLLESLSEEFAAKAAKETGPALAVSKKRVKELKVIDPKASQNFGILLNSSLKGLSFEELRILILKCDDSSLSPSVMESLLRFLPSGEDMASLRLLKDEHDELCTAEQFAFMLANIPRIEPRLQAMVFKKKFFEEAKEIKPDLTYVIAACEELKTSEKFGKCLELILLIGNYMNSGSRNAESYGFKLNFLTKLQNTKAHDNRSNMLHFLANLLENRYPQWVNFKDDLRNLEKARRVSDDQLSKQLRGMKKSLTNLKKELEFHKNPESIDDRFGTEMNAFLEYANDEYEKLEATYTNMGKCVAEIITFYGEDPKKTNAEEFFSDIVTFCNDFETARVENAKMKEAKKREEKQKELKEKEKRRKEQKEKERKDFIIDQQGEGEGVLDDLMDALKTGQAYNRDNRRQKPRQTRDGGKKDRNLSRGRSQTGHSQSPRNKNNSDQGDVLDTILNSTPTSRSSRQRSKTHGDRGDRESKASEALQRVRAL